jgi:hypothetical protein
VNPGVTADASLFWISKQEGGLATFRATIVRCHEHESRFLVGSTRICKSALLSKVSYARRMTDRLLNRK